MALEPGLSWDAPAPTEHGKQRARRWRDRFRRTPGRRPRLSGEEAQWITVELDHPVNPWEHVGAGSITWGANLDRLAPLGEEAVSIIKEAWEHQREDPRERSKREEEEAQPVERVPDASASIKPGWAGRVESRQYWIHLTLYQPINERWVEEAGENWSAGELINDGIVKRGVTVEATTRLGRRALRIIEALHSAHPFNELEPPERGSWMAREWRKSAGCLISSQRGRATARHQPP